jgi:3-oxoadipate enol-lactonase
VSPFPTVDVTVYPYDCDAFGHLNQGACLLLLERARWDALARGPGMDLFRRNGVWPAVRRTTIEYKTGAFPGDVLRVETAIVDRGTTSFTMRHVMRRLADDAVVADAEMVFVCINAVGRPTPVPEEVARVLGPSRATARDPLRVAADGAELAVEVRGEGLPVLLVHGMPFDRSMWRHQIAALPRCKRIACDMRGVGDSTSPADGYTLARYADDLVAVLDALGVRRAVVCGLSMGGYIAFELLRRHPDRIAALVLADTRAEADSADVRRRRDELAALAERDGTLAVAERLLPDLVSPATRSAQPELLDVVRAMAGRWTVPGLVGALRVLRDRPDSTETLSRVAVPALVLGGSDDAVTPPDVVKRLAAVIPGARYAAVAAAGHLAPLEQPLATTRLIADFLETL